MTEWREYKLSKIMETSKKHFKPDKNSQLNYIGLEHIEQGTLRLSGVGVSSSVESNKFFFNKGMYFLESCAHIFAKSSMHLLMEFALPTYGYVKQNHAVIKNFYFIF
jgi:hypothetical protein